MDSTENKPPEDSILFMRNKMTTINYLEIMLPLPHVLFASLHKPKTYSAFHCISLNIPTAITIIQYRFALTVKFGLDFLLIRYLHFYGFLFSLTVIYFRLNFVSSQCKKLYSRIHRTKPRIPKVDVPAEWLAG